MEVQSLLEGVLVKPPEEGGEGGGTNGRGDCCFRHKHGGRGGGSGSSGRGRGGGRRSSNNFLNIRKLYTLLVYIYY
jgi:hypothetical protein